MKTVLIYTFSFLVFFMTGCAKDKIPGVYRIGIQQGNEITQDMINQLKPGMTKNQVAYVMGTPLVIDTFQPERWDYIYSYHPGNGQREQRRITVHFNNETLNYIDGNTRIVPQDEMPVTVKVDSDVIVPLTNKKIGLIQDIKEKIGMDDEENVEDASEKVNLFENRPIPVPTRSKGLIERITGSDDTDDIEDDVSEVEQQTKTSLLKRFIGSGKEEITEEVDNNTIEAEVIAEQVPATPGFFQWLKNAFGISD